MTDAPGGRRPFGWLRDLIGGAGNLDRAIGLLRQEVSVLEEHLEGLRRGVANLERHQQRTDLHARIHPTMAWIEQADVAPDIKISVVLPTRDRRDLLKRAVRSVLEQSYPRWELIVVDDGSHDGTPSWLKTVEDERLVIMRSDAPVGVGGARNAGLGKATGHVVCYLDDDNVMYPGWLKAVAWAWARRPELEVLYGARLVEEAAELGIGGEIFPPVHFEPYDRRRLEEGNFIDMGVVAHRRSLPEARFGDDLDGLEDWDLILRLTRERPPAALPVIAVLYSTSQPGRLSDMPGKADRMERIKAGLRDRRGGSAGPGASRS